MCVGNTISQMHLFQVPSLALLSGSRRLKGLPGAFCTKTPDPLPSPQSYFCQFHLLPMWLYSIRNSHEGEGCEIPAFYIDQESMQKSMITSTHASWLWANDDKQEYFRAWFLRVTGHSVEGRGSQREQKGTPGTGWGLSEGYKRQRI